MNCIIVDDEPLAREGMVLNIKEVSFLDLVGSFENAVEAVEFIDKNEVDLIFLDIQMPELTGLDFLKSLKSQHLVILTTAYPQFALESYELDVVDYLVKPIRLERFVKAVNKAYEYHKLKKAPQSNIESIEEDFIFIKSDRKYIKLMFNDIIFIQGLKDYVVIHTEKEKIMTAMNVKTIKNNLPDKIFFRVNKSYIINVNHIRSIDNDFVIVKGTEIPIGKTYKDEFIDQYVNKKLIKR